MILITGAYGLVGTALTKTLEAVPLNADIDLCNFYEVVGAFQALKPEVIIHCAAKVGGILGNLNQQGEFFYKNILINTNVLQAAYIANVKKVISFGSSCAYPENAPQPYKEIDLHNGEPYNAHFAYAYAKRMLSVQSKAYNEQYGFSNLCIIPSNIYGPNDKFDLNCGHVMPSLLLKCLLAKRQNTDFTVWGTGAGRREFIFVNDVAIIIKKLLESNIDNNIHTINVTTGKDHKLEDVVNIIVEVMNFKGKVIYDTNKPDGQLKKQTSIDLLRSIIGNIEFTNIKDGIQITSAWLEKNYPNVRT